MPHEHREPEQFGSRSALSAILECEGRRGNNHILVQMLHHFSGGTSGVQLVFKEFFRRYTSIACVVRP